MIEVKLMIRIDTVDDSAQVETLRVATRRVIDSQSGESQS